MFDFWHWAGIKGVIRTYYRLNHSSAFAENVLQMCESTLLAHGLEAEVRGYAVNLAKRLRAIGCDKTSAYVAAACAYGAATFSLDTQRGKTLTLLIQDSLDNDEMLHPLAMAGVQKAKEEMLAAIENGN
jgi:hypothetical protein